MGNPDPDNRTFLAKIYCPPGKSSLDAVPSQRPWKSRSEYLMYRSVWQALGEDQMTPSATALYGEANPATGRRLKCEDRPSHQITMSPDHGSAADDRGQYYRS